MTKTTTGERLVKIETDIGYIKESVDELHGNMNKHFEWSEKQIMVMDKKYANKWVEKAIVAIAIGVIVFGLQQIITHVF